MDVVQALRDLGLELVGTGVYDPVGIQPQTTTVPDLTVKCAL
jgi:hypothetical protein